MEYVGNNFQFTVEQNGLLFDKLRELGFTIGEENTLDFEYGNLSEYPIYYNGKKVYNCYMWLFSVTGDNDHVTIYIVFGIKKL